MSQLGTLEAGSRHDLHVGISPDAPDESELRPETDGAFGYAHSYETASRYDGLVRVGVPASLHLLP